MMNNISMFLLIDIIKSETINNITGCHLITFFSLTSDQFASLVLRPQFNLYIFND